MAKSVATIAATVIDSPAPARDEAVGTDARELAQRRSGDVDVFLLWHPGLDQVELCLLDLGTGVSVHVEVAADQALDAFYHPYAYMSRHEPR